LRGDIPAAAILRASLIFLTGNLFIGVLLLSKREKMTR